MRKKIVVFLMAVLILSLISVSATQKWNPGDSYIPCYTFEQTYNFPTTTIPGGGNGISTVSFDIPSNPCPPVKMIEIGGQSFALQVDADTAITDQNIPSYTYQCTLSSDEGCCPSWGYVDYCTNGDVNLTLYDEQGEPRGFGQGEGCQQFGVYQTGWKVSRFEITNRGSTNITFTGTLYITCCYDCRKKPGLPATILYPKVDIENFAVAGGATIVKDGKLLTNLNLSPGVQQTFIQVENRGFFTQNDTRIRFDGLPNGVTVLITPETQKLKSHNLATYSATFTVGPNVPSGKYQVTLVAYSEKGMFDKLTFEFVVP